jgi:hypothetical protein
MIAADATAFALMMTTYALDDSVFAAEPSRALVPAARWTFLSSLSLYFLAPPIMHVVNGRPLVGLESFGLRLLGPIITATVGTTVGFTMMAITGHNVFHDTRPYDEATRAGLVVGATVGVLTVAYVDDFLLARRLAEPSRPTSRSTGSLRATPFVGPSARGAVLGLAGSW